jgi:hypothetical protein
MAVKATLPQRLKPFLILLSFCGATEVAPFQNKCAPLLCDLCGTSLREDVAKGAKKTKLCRYRELPMRCERDAVQYNLQAV